MMKTIVRCKCGHRIVARDILRTDLYVRTIAPNYIWIKYRCSRCKQMGEAFVAEDRFDVSILRKDKREWNDHERDKFSTLAEITSDELIDFRKQLDGTEKLEPSAFDPANEK